DFRSRICSHSSSGGKASITANHHSGGTDIHHLGGVPSTGCSTGGEDRERGGRRLHSRPTGGEIPGGAACWHMDAGSNQRLAGPAKKWGAGGGGLQDEE